VTDNQTVVSAIFRFSKYAKYHHTSTVLIEVIFLFSQVQAEHLFTPLLQQEICVTTYQLLFPTHE